MKFRSWCKVLAVWIGVSMASSAGAFKNVDEGQKAPDFSLRSLAGETVRLHEKLGPKALALAFWATWSPRSRPLLEQLDSLRQKLKDKGLEVLAVNVEHESLTPEERQTIAEWASKWSFPVLLDEGLGVFSAYGVVATPSVALLDAQGTMRYILPGYPTSAKEDLEEAIDSLLGISPDKAEKLGIKLRDYVPPKKATLHYQKAEVLIRRGMPKKAVKDLEEAAALDPQWPEPRLALARILQSGARGDAQTLTRAEALVREALAVRPQHAGSLTSLAEILLAEGRPGEALAASEEALAASAAYTPALLAKAQSSRALGRLDAAAAAVEEAIGLDPRDPHLYAEKGEVAVARSQWKEGAQALRRAAELAQEAQDRVRRPMEPSPP